MKIKLSPELSYVIGLWRKARAGEGLGVEGSKQVLEVFSQEVLEKGLTTSDKLLADEYKVYFYHTAYRKFFQQVEGEQLDRFKYLNEYAANYLAGMFDACGEIDSRGIVSMHRMTNQDEMMLLRLGFVTRRRGERIIVERPLVFLKFIKNYVRIFKDHQVFGMIAGASAVRGRKKKRGARPEPPQAEAPTERPEHL